MYEHSTSACLSMIVVWKKSTCAVVWVAIWTTFFMKHFHLNEWQTSCGYLCLNVWQTYSQKWCNKLGMVPHAYNPSYSGPEVGGSLEPRSLRLQYAMIVPLHYSLGNMVKPISTKDTKISGAWWSMPVIPVTRLAEAGESIEPRKWRL